MHRSITLIRWFFAINISYQTRVKNCGCLFFLRVINTETFSSVVPISWESILCWVLPLDKFEIVTSISDPPAKSSVEWVCLLLHCPFESTSFWNSRFLAWLSPWSLFSRCQKFPTKFFSCEMKKWNWGCLNVRMSRVYYDAIALHNVHRALL